MYKSFAAIAGLIAGAFLLAPSAQAQPPRGPGHGGPAPDHGSVRCESRDYRLTRCNVNWRDARLVRQTSSARCVRGQNWGVDRRGLWVDRGCAGFFAEAGGGPGHGPGPGGPGHGPGGWQPGPGWNTTLRLNCQSSDFRYKFCQVDVGAAGRVRVERQLSQAACVEGRSWGFNRAGVWVDKGCAATFVIDRRWR